MSRIEYIPVPAFEDNYIWVLTDGVDAIVVDPGEAGPVLNYLRKNRLDLSAIFITHHHNDHVAGVQQLLNVKEVPVFGPSVDQLPFVSHGLRDGDCVIIEKPVGVFNVLAVPGHTLDHIAYFHAADGAGHSHVLCGDTLFSCGCGRLFEGKPTDMLESLDKLTALPGETFVHCAHEYTLSNIKFALSCEPTNVALLDWGIEAESRRASGVPTLPTTIAHELATNPFLRLDEQSVRDTLSEHLGAAVLNRVAAFSLMRDWKNNYR